MAYVRNWAHDTEEYDSIPALDHSPRSFQSYVSLTLLSLWIKADQDVAAIFSGLGSLFRQLLAWLSIQKLGAFLLGQRWRSLLRELYFDLEAGLWLFCRHAVLVSV
jgi:hypothetical protein